MAIKVSSQTVINNSLALENVAEFEGLFTNFHPLVSAITTDIDFTKPFVTLAMTGNVTFTTSNRNTGKQVTLLLDTSTTPYAPTWPSEVKFPTAITWSSSRFWTISFTCWDASTVRATALPYVAAGTQSSTMDSSFSLTGLQMSRSINSSVGFPQAWLFVEFARDDANSRIVVNYASGTSAAQATVYTDYINYTGLTGIDPNNGVQVQYNVSGQSCQGDCNASNYSFGPTPASDGYNSGTYYNVPASPGARQFSWMAEGDPNTNNPVTTITTADFGSANPDFRVKVVSNEGTFYSTGEMPGNILTLTASEGNQAL